MTVHQLAIGADHQGIVLTVLHVEFTRRTIRARG